MALVEKRLNENGIRFHFIPSKKFKTINFIAKFKAPLERETITKRALIPYILKEGTKNYPSRQALRYKLDDLYGGVFAAYGSKKGENHIITLRLELANPKFIPEETTNIEEGIALFNELLFHPNITNEAFQEHVVEREKNTLKQKMDSLLDDKMQYANQRLVEEMCKDEPYGVRIHGYEEDLTKINHQNLYSYFKELIQEDELDIYVLGDIDVEKLSSSLTSLLKRDGGNPKVSKGSESKGVQEAKEVIENQQIQQAKLHIGYRTGVTYRDKLYPALHVFNGIFGGFPSSKLFINVREKNSLAYYASSRMESHKGLLFVFSGIAPENYEKAKKIIDEQLLAMKEGDFTDKDLAEVKELVQNQLLETMDHPQGLVELLYQQILANRDLMPDELINQIKTVTKDDVVEVAKKVEEDTTFLLTTNEGGQGNE